MRIRLFVPALCFYAVCVGIAFSAVVVIGAASGDEQGGIIWRIGECGQNCDAESGFGNVGELFSALGGDAGRSGQADREGTEDDCEYCNDDCSGSVHMEGMKKISDLSQAEFEGRARGGAVFFICLLCFGCVFIVSYLVFTATTR
jgi:hypothetical protein